MVNFTSSFWNTYKKNKKHISSPLITLFLILLNLMTISVIAQNPCEVATRWNSGDGWRYNNTKKQWEAVRVTGSNPLPLGIVACASAASTQSGLEAFKTLYTGTGRVINTSLTECFSMANGSENNTVQGPIANQSEIVWFNFDIRPNAGTYQFQIVSNQSIGWVLYYSNKARPNGLTPVGTGANAGKYPAVNSSTKSNNLSGDCSDLTYARCGLSGNGWSTITVPSFNEPTNYYLAAWPLDNGGKFSNSANLVYKSRFGCGGATCVLQKDGNDTKSCNTNSTYTVCANYFGGAGKWKLIDNALTKATSYTITTYTLKPADGGVQVEQSTSTNLSTNPIWLELGTINGSSPQNDVYATICATYATGVDYDISLVPDGTPANAPNDYIACTSNGRFYGTGLSNTTVTPGTYGPVCVNGSAITLGGTPSGGTWTGTGVSAKQGGGYEFNPATAGVGTFTLTYSVAASSTTCANSNTTSIEVKDLTTVTPGTYGPVCVNGSAITLGGTPSGGTWTGTGVSAKQGGGYEFNPATAGVGTFTLTYSVAASSTTCANSNTTSIEVKDLTTVTPGTYGPVCVNGSAITLGGTPSGGTWTGTGVSAKQGGGYEFNPATAGVGTFTLTYSVAASSTTCANSNTTSITVNGRPNQVQVTPTNPSCSSITGSIEVNSPKNTVQGDNYTYKYTSSGYSTNGFVTNTNFTFKAGAGYSIIVKDKNGCESIATTCTADPNFTECAVTTKVSGQTEEVKTTDRLTDITARIGANKARVLAAPNPFTDRVRFTLISDVSGQGSLEIYNTVGQKVATVYQGYVEAGKTLNKEYVVKRAQRAELIYIFRVGDQKTTGKLLNW